MKDEDYLKLRNEVFTKDNKIDKLASEIQDMHKIIKRKDHKINKL